MSGFLKDTFRPFTAEEEQGIHRYRHQKAICSLICGTLLLILIGVCALIDSVAQRSYTGTWVFSPNHIDGFQPEDSWLEMRDGEFYLNGSHYGSLTREDGLDFIPVQTPIGNYNRYLSIENNVLTIRYKPPRPDKSSDNNFTYDSIEPTDLGSIFDRVQGDVEILNMYTRISRKTNLTEEQRSKLY